MLEESIYSRFYSFKVIFSIVRSSSGIFKIFKYKSKTKFLRENAGQILTRNLKGYYCFY